jgi:hypothetical protein
MAAYKNLADFNQKVTMDGIKTRADFLYKVKYATIADTSPYPDHPSLKALLFSGIGGLVCLQKSCYECDSMFTPFYRKPTGGWVWRQRSQECAWCGDKMVSIVKGTIFQGMPLKNMMSFLDVLTMWSFDYTKLLMVRESKCCHSEVENWVAVFQKAVMRDLMNNNDVLNLSKIPGNAAIADQQRRKSLAIKQSNKRKASNKGRSAAAKQEAAKKQKPKTATKAMKAVPVPVKPDKHNQTFYKRYKYVIQLDEAHLNKRKPGKIARCARPVLDQVWVWGATLQGRPDVFHYRILEHPVDAHDGRPRGTEEILTCLHMLNLQKGTILVTDGWKGTAAAIRRFRQQKGWTVRELHHEVVNHSAGEIVNCNGFTTNHIEGRWSVIKRWGRKRYGGRLPAHNDRTKWNALLAEFQWRKIISKDNSQDGGHTYQVSFASVLNALSQLSV